MEQLGRSRRRRKPGRAPCPDAGKPGEDQDRGLDLETRKLRNTSKPDMPAGSDQQDDVVIVELAEIDALFAQIGGVDVEART
jgi:hypothetical protein